MKGGVATSSDPFVIMTAMEPPEAHTPATHTAPITSMALAETDVDFHDHDFTQKFKYTTKVVNDNLNPVWNEEILVSGCNGFSTLIFTVLDKDDIQINDYDFLGQCTKSINTENLWADSEAFTETFELSPLKHSVHKKPDTKVGMDTSGKAQGTLTIEFIPKNSNGTAAGPCERYCKSKSIMGSGNASWESKWAVMHCRPGAILTFDALSYDGNNPEKVIPATEIGDVDVERSLHGRTSVLVIGRKNKKPVYLSFPKEGEALMWKTKIKILKKQTAELAWGTAESGGSSQMGKRKSGRGFW